MPRVKLTSMLDDVKTTLDPAPQQPIREASTPVSRPQLVSDPADSATSHSQAPLEGETQATRRPAVKPERPRRERATAEVAHVHYASLVRKEARLRDDQIQSLTDRARKLSRSKVGSDERITDNTLIRIAIDLLLARQVELAGNSEAELRKSVGL